ncbi:MAG: sigma-70 family RNA polymerase sigma factor [Bryobacterales bacterium]|nr:sigma-70 family RNA polymerase sigma factor [Bryobacterales bacterium]
MTQQEFSIAYSDNFGLTRRFLLSRGMNAARADELAQAAWSKAWERRSQLRELTSVSAWVNTIALNLLRGEIRKSAPQVELSDRDEPISASVDEHLDAETLLGALNKQDRRLMLLHVVAGMTSNEIAKDAKLSPVAVRVRLHRAKVQLRERFAGSAPQMRRTSRGDRRRGCKTAQPVG